MMALQLNENEWYSSEIVPAAVVQKSINNRNR